MTKERRRARLVAAAATAGLLAAACGGGGGGTGDGFELFCRGDVDVSDGASSTFAGAGTWRPSTRAR